VKPPGHVCEHIYGRRIKMLMTEEEEDEDEDASIYMVEELRC
jgi:hypothetical protein